MADNITKGQSVIVGPMKDDPFGSPCLRAAMSMSI